MAKSIEEKIEDWAKDQIKKDKDIKIFIKNESMTKEIDKALEILPSKSGGTGNNYPDIKVLLKTKENKMIPVMIEVKGKKGDFIKIDDATNRVANFKKDNTPNYNNIKKYAVNGAIHYANGILLNTQSYDEVIAIGINGYEEPNGEIRKEIGAYYISRKNLNIEKKIADYTDLSFLYTKNIDALLEKISNIGLTDIEIEEKAKLVENEIEIKLKKLNQQMQDTLKISVGSRVELLIGMIMAGLGVENKVTPLDISELKGNDSKSDNDGQTIIRKINSFLENRNLPIEKIDMIINDLSRVFIYSDLYKPVNGESKLKTIYSVVKEDILPIFSSKHHLDFTGKLFNVLNTWVDVPDSDKNDVVLTPRYVTDLMAKLCEVNKNSYVWDYAVGSGGFLISSMKQMINDATDTIQNPDELRTKILKIKAEQLLGVEKRSDIYLLAVLNMIIMGDGSSNIIHKDSLNEFLGKYEQGRLKDTDFPANVFLLNPPYSADGKGFIFVENALNRMKSGKAAVLIQENAGSGNGIPYTKRLLKNNTLLASIKMADIFRGKAGVQTAIYLFDVGIPHNEKKLVKFINFENDGYTRQNRKKSGQDVNLKNTDHAIERYQEVVDVVLYGEKYLTYLSKDEYIEDTISLNGDDWTFMQHKVVDTKPTLEDFKNTVAEYLAWEVSQLLLEN